MAVDVSGRRASGKLTALVAVLAIATVYALTGPGNRSEADDAFWFAYDAEHASLRDLLSGGHTAHLLFLPLARAFYSLFRLVDHDIRAYDAIRLTNCFVGATAVVLFATVLRRRLGLSSFAAATGAAGLAVSYGFWRYANEAEVYSLAVLTVAGLCLLAFSGLRSTAAVVAAGIVAAFGTLIHILGVVPAVALVPLALLLERRIRQLAIYGLVFALIVGGVTLAAYSYVEPRQSYAGYLLSAKFSPDLGATVRVIPQSLLNLGQNIATGNFLFAYRGIAQETVKAFPGRFLAEEQYAGEHAGSLVRIVPPITLALLILLSIVVIACRQPERRLPGSVSRSVAVVVAWIMLYWLVVVAGGSSSAPEAWIPILPAAWILVAVVFFDRSATGASRNLVLALLVVLSAHNLVGGWYMMRSNSTDYNYLKARWLVQHTHNGDVILTADGFVFASYLRYHSEADVVDLEGRSFKELTAEYNQAVARSAHVFATTAVFDPGIQLRTRDEMTFHALEQFGEAIRSQFRKAAETDLGAVYVRGGLSSEPESQPLGDPPRSLQHRLAVPGPPERRLGSRRRLDNSTRRRR